MEDISGLSARSLYWKKQNKVFGLSIYCLIREDSYFGIVFNLKLYCDGSYVTKNVTKSVTDII
jgi:hypothetical protein